MRDGVYEMFVLDEHEKRFPELYIGGQWVIQAKPGAAYHVQVNIYRDIQGQFPAPYLRLGLFVDGEDVQYWKRLDFSNPRQLPKDRLAPITSVFWGFKKNTSEIRSFVFATPHYDSSNPSNHDNHNSNSSSSSSSGSNPSSKPELGTIRLIVHEAKVTHGTFANNTGVRDTHSSSTSKTVSENTKFWQQPSAITTIGQRVHSTKEKFLPLIRWENCSPIPIYSMTLHYHQADVIRFLQSPSLQLKRKYSEGVEGDETRKKQLRRNLAVEEEEDADQEEGDEAVEEIIVNKEVLLIDLCEDTPIIEKVILKK